MKVLRSIRSILARVRTRDRTNEETGEPPLLWSSIASQLLATALISAALVLAALHFTDGAAPRVVVFDILKFANAQRAVAEKFVTARRAEEVAPLLLDLSQRTRTAIRDIAGPSTLVVIRQAVVHGETRDITDEVLRRLGLPTQVPTADPTRHVLDIAPTLLGSGPRMLMDDPPRRADPALPLP